MEDEYESGALPAYDPSAMHDGSEEPNTNSFYSDEDSTEMEDMQMFDDGGQGQDTIHLGGFVPEFEPVEITPVNYNENRCVEAHATMAVFFNKYFLAGRRRMMMRTVSMMWRRSPMICVKSATTSQVIINIIKSCILKYFDVLTPTISSKRSHTLLIYPRRILLEF